MKISYFSLVSVFCASALLLSISVSSAALDSDRAALVQLVASCKSSSETALQIAINSGYAIVSYTDGNGGGELLATNSGAGWSCADSTGGAYSPSWLQTKGVSASIAQYLTSSRQYIPSADAPTQSVADNSTSQHFTERCLDDSFSPPRWYTQAVVTQDTSVSYSTGSVTPNSLPNAIALFIAPSVGNVSMSLTDPTGQVVATTTVVPGANAGIIYSANGAATGQYTFTLTGPVAGGGDCGASHTAGSTVVDAAWTGTLYL